MNATNSARTRVLPKGATRIPITRTPAWPAMMLVLLLAGAPAAWAQPDAHGWKQAVNIYLLAPTISGTVGIGPADADLDVDPGAVFDSLDGAFLGMYMAEKDRWGVFMDIVYMDLKEDLETPNGLFAGTFGNKQFVGGLAATYRLNDRWQLLGGGMYTDITMRLDLAGPLQTRRLKRSESWVDPFVGARFATRLGEKWSFAGFGIVGGFGVGSDLLWSVNAGFAYSFTDTTSLLLGFRYIDFDYEDGSGLDRFKFDVAQYGPAVGVRFDF